MRAATWAAPARRPLPGGPGKLGVRSRQVERVLIAWAGDGLWPGWRRCSCPTGDGARAGLATVLTGGLAMVASITRLHREGVVMQLSTERILTTHTGSLPRPASLPRAGTERTAEQLAEAVGSVVQAQLDAGIDVVNEGEASKPSYATYGTERLSGFGGTGEHLRPKDFDDFPLWAERMTSDPGRARRLASPACIGPVSYRDPSLVQADIANLRQATAGRDVADVFMSAASPGVIAIFQQNQYYGSDEEYIAALADAMKTEYDAIHAAGLVLQLDCPDLAMGWNVSRLGRTQEGFLVPVAGRVAAINP